MNRCSLPSLLLAALPLLVQAQDTTDDTVDATTQSASAPVAASTPSMPVPTSTRQVMVPMALARLLPPESLRGEVLISQGQLAVLNGKAAETLAPGLRVRGPNNMLITPVLLIGKKLTVNYVRDTYGLINQMWILRDDERAKLWPKTAQEAAKWTYNPYTQTWTK